MLNQQQAPLEGMPAADERGITTKACTPRATPEDSAYMHKYMCQVHVQEARMLCMLGVTAGLGGGRRLNLHGRAAEVRG